MNDAQSQFIAVCPDCSANLRVNFSKLGQHIVCPQCRRTFVAGEASLPAAQRSAERPVLPSNQPSDQVDRIAAKCPGCEATLHVRRAYIGNDVRCKYCDQVFQVRDSSEGHPKTEDDPPAALQNSLQNDHEQLYVAHNLLQADHDRLKTECSVLRENLGRVTTELDAVRAALGTIAPEEVGSLANERQSLAEEVHRLRDEIHALLATQTERDQLAAERQQWLSELNVAHAERDLLAKDLRDRDERLEVARAEHDRLRSQEQTTASEVEQLRLALAQNNEAAHSESLRLRSEVESLRGELDLAEQSHRAELDGLNDELASLQEKQRRLQSEYDLARERDSDEQSKSAAVNRQHERWTGQHPVLGIVSDEMAAPAGSSTIGTLPSPGEGRTVAAELADLGAQLAKLTQRLDESEHLNRDMAAALGGLGIRCRSNRG